MTLLLSLMMHIFPAFPFLLFSWRSYLYIYFTLFFKYYHSYVLVIYFIYLLPLDVCVYLLAIIIPVLCGWDIDISGRWKKVFVTQGSLAGPGGGACVPVPLGTGSVALF